MPRIIIISDLSGWLAGTHATHQLHTAADRPADRHFPPCVQLDRIDKATPDGIGWLRLSTRGSRRERLWLGVSELTATQANLSLMRSLHLHNARRCLIILGLIHCQIRFYSLWNNLTLRGREGAARHELSGGVVDVGNHTSWWWFVCLVPACAKISLMLDLCSFAGEAFRRHSTSCFYFPNPSLYMKEVESNNSGSQVFLKI